jgi:hypothetical protein
MLSVTMTGCDFLGDGNRITELPAEVVVWSDPDAGNESAYLSVRDANDIEDRFILIGTGGEVQFSTGKVCNLCEAQGATIAIEGTPRVNIRFGVGPDGVGPRRPFLVSTDGFYIQLVSDGETVAFQEEGVRFEDDDNLADDLAQPAGSVPNPALDNPS